MILHKPHAIYLVRALAVVYVVIGLAALTTSCVHPPATVTTPEGQRAFNADQIVQRLGEFQSAVIDLSRAGKIKLEDARIIVAWVSGDKNATPPVTGVIDILRAYPASGPTGLVNASWQTARPRVVAVPDLADWVPVLDQLLGGL